MKRQNSAFQNRFSGKNLVPVMTRKNGIMLDSAGMEEIQAVSREDRQNRFSIGIVREARDIRGSGIEEH